MVQSLAVFIFHIRGRQKQGQTSYFDCVSHLKISESLYPSYNTIISSILVIVSKLLERLFIFLEVCLRFMA